MAFDFKIPQDLFGIIQKINNKFFRKACENIVYLEELSNENYIAYMVSLRDAYSHLVKLFESSDFSSLDQKAKIERQLERYSSHLERLLFDTYQKIFSIKAGELLKTIPENQVFTIKTQLAMEMKRLRIVDDGTTIDAKIEGYEKIIVFIEDIYKKFLR